MVLYVLAWSSLWSNRRRHDCNRGHNFEPSWLFQRFVAAMSSGSVAAAEAVVDDQGGCGALLP
eukprot:2905976-Pyramimonas_sp.AAC.1